MIATVLFLVALFAIHFQPEVEGAVAHVAKAVLDLGRPARVIAPPEAECDGIGTAPPEATSSKSAGEAQRSACAQLI